MGGTGSGRGVPAVAVDTGELAEGEDRARRAGSVVADVLARARALGGEAALPVGAFVVRDAVSDLARQWCARLVEVDDAVGPLRGTLAAAAEDYRLAEMSAYEHLVEASLPLPLPLHGPPAPTHPGSASP